MLAPHFEIVSEDFNLAWLHILRNCLKGKQITFGDIKNPKHARDTTQTIFLQGDAIKQIEKRDIHPANPFKLINQYCDEFTWPYLKKYDLKPEDDKFEYQYFDRFVRYDGFINQLQAMRNDLEVQIATGICTNRSQAITWQPEEDMGNVASPCLQRIRIRHEGDLQVSVHFDWRSRDGWGAYQHNLVSLVDMIYREILDPNDCIISRIKDTNDSIHIYRADVPSVIDLMDQSFYWGM